MISDEEAKAVQETAKATVRFLDSIDGVGCFFDAVLGYPIREAGGFLGDWVKFKRDNWRKTVEMSQKVLSQRDIDHIDPIPAKYAIDIIQRSALEDDELLQRMWAGLIANSLDPEVDTSPSKALISLLSDMEPLDALLLMKISTLNKGEFVPLDAARLMALSVEALLFSIETLCRLGLLRHNISAAYGGEAELSENSRLSLTTLSKRLLASVQTELLK